MKKFFLTSAVLVGGVATTGVFALSPIVERFTSLSEQIIEQAEKPFDKLEELKMLFTSCAEKNASEIGSACTEWISHSYSKIKEATPQQIYIELGTGDVKVKKIGKKRHYDDGDVNGSVYSTGDVYEIRIPKYGSYIDVRKVYRKLYEEIFCLKDWKGLKEEKHLHGKEKANRLPNMLSENEHYLFGRQENYEELDFMGHLQDFIFIMALGYKINIEKILIKGEFLKMKKLVKLHKNKNEENKASPVFLYDQNDFSFFMGFMSIKKLLKTDFSTLNY